MFDQSFGSILVRTASVVGVPLEAETRVNGICLPSGRKTMARFLLSLPFVRTPHFSGVWWVPHMHPQHLKVWAGCRVTRTLRQEVLPVSI